MDEIAESVKEFARGATEWAAAAVVMCGESIVDNNGASMDIAIHNIAQRSLETESMAKALSELSLQSGATTEEFGNGVKTINRCFEEYEAKK